MPSPDLSGCEAVPSHPGFVTMLSPLTLVLRAPSPSLAPWFCLLSCCSRPARAGGQLQLPALARMTALPPSRSNEWHSVWSWGKIFFQQHRQGPSCHMNEQALPAGSAYFQCAARRGIHGLGGCVCKLCAAPKWFFFTLSAYRAFRWVLHRMVKNFELFVVMSSENPAIVHLKVPQKSYLPPSHSLAQRQHCLADRCICKQSHWAVSFQPWSVTGTAVAMGLHSCFLNN